MAGQVSQEGSQALANAIGGLVPPHIGTSAPTWVPGLVWINTSSGAVLMVWNSVAWVAGPESLYLALLTGDPSQASLSTPGAYAQTVADIASVEDTTAGYTRQPVTFGDVVGSTYPAQIANAGVITWGPYTAAQTLPVQWAALVTCSSGNVGLLKYMWTLPEPAQVSVSQSIQIGVGTAIVSVS